MGANSRKVKTHFVLPGQNVTKCGWETAKLKYQVWTDRIDAITCQRCIDKASNFDTATISTNAIIGLFPELTITQLDGWVRKGWVSSQLDHPGRGKNRHYNVSWLPIIAAMNMMVNRIGMNPNYAAPLARRIAELACLGTTPNDPFVYAEHEGIRIGLPWKELRQYV